jgi:hypothetical protein
MKKLCYYFSVTCLLLLSFGVTGGSISYPVLGNLYMPQGTIEMWLIPQVEPMGENMLKKNYWGHPLFTVKQSDSSFQLLWMVRKGRSCPVALHAVGKTGLNHYLPVEKWGKGEPRHIAYCWDSGKDWWIIDGVEMPVKQHSEWHRASIGTQLRMILGSEKIHGMFVIDDLRISSVARRTDEVGFHHPGKLKNDPWTLLLDNFDSPIRDNGIQRTTPQVMTPAADGKSGGIPDRNCSFVPGISGTGLRL